MVGEKHRSGLAFLAVGMESVDHEIRQGFIGRHWRWVKSLVVKLKEKVVEVGRKAKKLGQEDPRRIVHSLKAGLAVTLVSLLYYFKPIYGGFGASTMWAILTVVVVFEFSVGKKVYYSFCLASFMYRFLGLEPESTRKTKKIAEENNFLMFGWFQGGKYKRKSNIIKICHIFILFLYNKEKQIQ